MSDPVAIAGYLGGTSRFDEAVTAFAQAYAVQNAQDHRALRHAVDQGRVPVAPGG